MSIQLVVEKNPHGDRRRIQDVLVLSVSGRNMEGLTFLAEFRVEWSDEVS
jgi:hypothetical protein